MINAENSRKLTKTPKKPHYQKIIIILVTQNPSLNNAFKIYVCLSKKPFSKPQYKNFIRSANKFQNWQTTIQQILLISIRYANLSKLTH
jgi:hypothetical protein